jgi:hypothetical protein
LVSAGFRKMSASENRGKTPKSDPKTACPTN